MSQPPAVTFQVPRSYRRALQAERIGRAFWLLLWHNLRVKRRALRAELEHEILYGRQGGSAPVGILRCCGL